jgi:hypothetical protein
MASLESLSKFISPPPAHMSNSNISIDQNTGKRDNLLFREHFHFSSTIYIYPLIV